MKIETVWLVVGFLGQAMFFLRFLVQWLASEKEKRSVIPKTFWYFSIIGGVIVLFYAIHRHDPVFIIGQCCGVLIYVRNLYFVYSHKESVAS